MALGDGRFVTLLGLQHQIDDWHLLSTRSVSVLPGMGGGGGCGLSRIELYCRTWSLFKELSSLTSFKLVSLLLIFPNSREEYVYPSPGRTMQTL